VGFRALAVHVLSVLPQARNSSLLAGLAEMLAAAGGWQTRYYEYAPLYHLLSQSQSQAQRHSLPLVGTGI
jgi:hypothetical protein